MAVERIWFPHVPDGTINAADRARQGIGYGGITHYIPPVLPNTLSGRSPFRYPYAGYAR